MKTLAKNRHTENKGRAAQTDATTQTLIREAKRRGTQAGVHLWKDHTMTKFDTTSLDNGRTQRRELYEHTGKQRAAAPQAWPAAAAQEQRSRDTTAM